MPLLNRLTLCVGARLALAEAAMTDRTGATHLTGVEPDERIAIDWTAYGTDHDPVLVAAMEWLNHQPACANGTSSMLEQPHLSKATFKLQAKGTTWGRRTSA